MNTQGETTTRMPIPDFPIEIPGALILELKYDTYSTEADISCSRGDLDDYYDEVSTNGFVAEYDNEYYAKIINEENNLSEEHTPFPFLSDDEDFKGYNDVSVDGIAEEVIHLELKKDKIGNQNNYLNNHNDVTKNHHLSKTFDKNLNNVRIIKKLVYGHFF